ncbi:hypothetical protein PDTK01_38240 [Phycicoccus sp. DTK01]|nr:hypothetical protein PDTK01_38240 [Phycicoccus sp. DTK01]
MSAATRLALFGAALALVFVASFTAAGALVPQAVVTRWEHQGQTPHSPASTTSHQHGGSER